MIIKSKNKKSNSDNFYIKDVIFKKNYENDYKLHDGDEVIILDYKDLNFITSDRVLSILNNISINYSNPINMQIEDYNCKALNNLMTFRDLEENSNLNNSSFTRFSKKNFTNSNLIQDDVSLDNFFCPNIYKQYPSINFSSKKFKCYQGRYR